jgi:hypothetical protein
LVDVCNGGRPGDRDCLVYGEFSGDQGGIDKPDKESEIAVGEWPRWRRRLKIKVGADPQSETGDIGMIEIGESFHQIQPEDGQDIVYTDTGFYIRFSAQGVGG